MQPLIITQGTKNELRQARAYQLKKEQVKTVDPPPPVFSLQKRSESIVKSSNDQDQSNKARSCEHKLRFKTST
jgi:hypothetical protein